MKEKTNRSLVEVTIRRGKRHLKRAVFLLRPRGKARPVFIMGYGRSGTTMLSEAFDHDMRIEVLWENDSRIARDYVLIRERVAPVIKSSRASLIVLKPILDSFAAGDLLRAHPTSRIIWMLREFEDVVASAIKKFGTTVADYMKNIVENGTGDSWLARSVPQSILDQLHDVDTSSFGLNDWMALVWWSVNRTLLSPDLWLPDRVLLMRYEELVQNPDESMRRIYEFIDLPLRRGSSVWINASSIGKGAGLDFDPTVRHMCSELLAGIDRHFA